MAERNFEALIGNKFLSRGETIEQHPLKTFDVVCLFFSANWCPPCNTFLPKLVEFYNEINLETKILEIIYVSRDKSKEEFEEHYEKMPWISIPFGDTRNRRLVENHDIKGIPILLVLKKNGEQLISTGKNDVIDEGFEVINKWIAGVNASVVNTSVVNAPQMPQI